ncbi:hypothetical protein PAXINDRAFT_102375 [Paxillus involutus ATCC 200175]|uniref:DNA 3'-5' helicase n=1 Tax=Paxillus involutus ATCC 200175 TaxID=664439 RepID=A0A0C9TDF2_PAXIN|nr:hypothetical protein PAXINDRAFT_102375 [Paxillus involutus ATCC 200175]
MFHQQVLQFKHFDREITLERHQDEMFHCPSCQFARRNPNDIRKHIKEQCGTVDQECYTADEAIDEYDQDDDDDDIGSDSGHEPITDAQDFSASRTLQSHSDSTIIIRPRVMDIANDDEFTGGFSQPSAPSSPFFEQSETVNLDIPASADEISAHTATLAQLGLMVDHTYHLVICTQCEEAVPALHLRTHIVSTHSLKCPPFSELSDILVALGVAQHKPLPTRSIIPPIHGLSVGQGLKCTKPSCDLVFASERSFRRHQDRQHPHSPVHGTPCSIQEVFASRREKVVLHVDPNIAISNPNGTLTDYLTVMRPVIDSSSIPLNPSDDPRKLNAFLYSTRWDNVVKGLTINDIQHLVALPASPDQMFHIVSEIRSLFTHMCDVISSMDVLTRRHINTPKGDMATTALENRPFGRPQTDAYLHRCANHWSQYICALLRSADAGPSDVSIHLTVHQRSLCHALLNALTEGCELREHIRSLSFAMLATYDTDIERDNSLCPLSRFLVFFHLRDDGTFDPPTSISPNLASFTFSIRAIAVLDACFHIQFHPDSTFLSYYKQHLYPLLKEGFPTPFNTLRQLTHLVSTYAYDSVKFPDMHWNEARDTLSVKGHPLRISLIPDMVQSLCKKAESVLEQLLIGVDTIAFDTTVQTALGSSNQRNWPIDPLRNTNEGFSFVHSPDNPFLKHLDMLLRHIHGNPHVFQTYHTKDAKGNIVHKPTAMLNYIRLHADLVDDLMVLAHITTPGVARGTELGPLRSVNDIDGPRNFFFLSGHCALICQYTKTRSNTGRDGYVAHFLPDRVSRLFIYLVGPIRELILAFVNTVMPDRYKIYQTSLFVASGKTIDSGMFSTVLKRYTLEHLFTPLSIAPYRQALKAILRAVMHVVDDQDVQDDAMDTSFGHSTVTANTRYGLVLDDLPGLTENTYIDAMRLAARYHTWLGFTSTSMESSTTSHQHLPDLIRRLGGVIEQFECVAPQLDAIQNTRISNLNTIHSDILTRCLPIIQDTITNTLAHRVPWSSHLQLPPPLNPQTEHIHIHTDRVVALSQLFRQEPIFFKSLQQGLAIETVSRRHPHVLVVLRTGGGKSAVFQAPSLADKKGFRVIIIPYVSLMDQAVMDADTKGVPYTIWSPTNDNFNLFTYRVVFAAVEHFSSKAFRQWLRSCHASGYLNGIVVDEAHDILLSRDYRESFCALSYLGEIGCQIVLLTGTISPSVEGALWKAVGLDSRQQPIRVIREPTSRANIRFNVTKVLAPQLINYVSHIITHHVFRSPADRGIAFCEFVDDAKDLAARTSVPFYVGAMDREARSIAQATWTSGRSRWLCATSAFAQGIDYGHVTYVLHAVMDADTKGVPYTIWSPTNDNFNLFTYRVVFAAVEHFSSKAFRQWLRSCHASGYLNGIVVDEAHDILLSRDYRESFCALSYLGEIGCQIVLLTGTISPSVEGALWKAVGLDSRQQPIRVIREPTSRANIRFNVTKVLAPQLINYVSHIITHHVFRSPADRGIAFCEFVDDAKDLAARTSVPFYVGAMDREARSIAQATWTSGRSRWLCATSAFAQGIDYGHVTYVLHVRVPKHATLHAQQSGRLARREGVGISHLVYSTIPSPQDIPEVDHGGVAAMIDFTPLPPVHHPIPLQCPPSVNHRPTTADPSEVILQRTISLTQQSASTPPIPYPPRVRTNPVTSASTLRQPHQQLNTPNPAPPDATSYPPRLTIPVPEPSHTITTPPVTTMADARACSLPKDKKEQTILKFLQEWAGSCVLHAFIAGHSTHKLFSCSLYNHFSEGFSPFRSKIRLERGMCFRCGVPTSPSFDHPFRDKGDTKDCRYDDILKPLSFLIYSVPSIRDVVLQEAGTNQGDFANVQRYAAWIGTTRAGPQGMSNLLEIAHAYFHLLSQNKLPPVSAADLTRAST